MAAPIRVHDANKVDWVLASTMAADDTQLSEAELGANVAFHEPGSDDAPQMFALRYLPSTKIEVHAHCEDEIIYIVAGSMKLGTREIGPGSSLFVRGGTLYSFAAGEDGLHLINFRPRRDLTFITPDQHRKMRRACQNEPEVL